MKIITNIAIAIALVLQLNSLGVNAGEPEVLLSQHAVKVAQPIDKVWSRALKFLALNSISPTAIDKESGLITASGPTTDNNNLTCSGRPSQCHLFCRDYDGRLCSRQN